MNHRSGVIKLGKDRKHRISMARNLATELFRHERVKTTLAKGRLLRSFAEPLIERAKEDSLHNRRQVFRHIKDTTVVKKLFETLGKRFADRKGGYTRMLKLGWRHGDAGEVCLIELVEAGSVAAETDKKATVESK